MNRVVTVIVLSVIVLSFLFLPVGWAIGSCVLTVAIGSWVDTKQKSLNVMTSVMPLELRFNLLLVEFGARPAYLHEMHDQKFQNISYADLSAYISKFFPTLRVLEEGLNRYLVYKSDLKIPTDFDDDFLGKVLDFNCKYHADSMDVDLYTIQFFVTKDEETENFMTFTCAHDDLDGQDVENKRKRYQAVADRIGATVTYNVRDISARRQMPEHLRNVERAESQTWLRKHAAQVIDEVHGNILTYPDGTTIEDMIGKYAKYSKWAGFVMPNHEENDPLSMLFPLDIHEVNAIELHQKQMISENASIKDLYRYDSLPDEIKYLIHDEFAITDLYKQTLNYILERYSSDQ